MANYTEENQAVLRAIGDGVENSFDINFVYEDEGDLLVYVNEELQQLNSEYTVTNGSESSGSITMARTPESADVLVVIRDTQLKRVTDFETTARFTADLVDGEYNQGLRQIADTRRNTTNISAPKHLTGKFNGEIQDFEAGAFLVINEDGDGVESKALSELSEFTGAISEVEAIATGAVSTANSAETIANNAASTAGNAESIADTATASANAATVTANSAAVTANEAYELAETAEGARVATEYNSTAYFIEFVDSSDLADGDLIRTLGFYSKGSAGGAVWKKTGNTGSVSQYPDAEGNITDSAGNEYTIVADKLTTSFSFGSKANYNASTQSGTDNSNAFYALLYTAKEQGIDFNIGAGDFYLSGARLNFDQAGVYHGAGYEQTTLWFGGSPSKTQETYVTWKSEYDTGDYSSSADEDVAYAIKASAKGVVIKDFAVETATEYTGYTTPWNATTDVPTTEYAYGLLVTTPEVTVERFKAYGVWSKFGLCVNGTVGAFGDGFTATEVMASGRYGLGIVGPEGELDSGFDYEDLADGDSRCSAGMSDLDFRRCTFYTSFATLNNRLYIDGSRTRARAYSSDAGGMYISGQAGNSAGRIQGIRFWDTRFSGAEYYTYFINYANRVEFWGCHCDTNSDAIDTDGGDLSSSDFYVKTTSHCINTQYHGGELGGSNDERTLTSDAGYRAYSEYGFRSEASNDRVAGFMCDYLSDNGSFTPTLSSTSGSATYSTQKGYWVKIGNVVKLFVRIDISSVDTLSGSLTIPVPFSATSKYYTTFSANMGVVQNIDVGDGLGGVMTRNADSITLFQYRANNSISTLNADDLSDGSRLDLNIDIVVDI